MAEARVIRKVSDLKLGDFICGTGVVRSVVPAQGGRVYVLLEKTVLDTATFEPDETVFVSLHEETAE